MTLQLAPLAVGGFRKPVNVSVLVDRPAAALLVANRVSVQLVHILWLRAPRIRVVLGVGCPFYLWRFSIRFSGLARTPAFPRLALLLLASFLA